MDYPFYLTENSGPELSKSAYGRFVEDIADWNTDGSCSTKAKSGTQPECLEIRLKIEPVGLILLCIMDYQDDWHRLA